MTIDYQSPFGLTPLCANPVVLAVGAPPRCRASPSPLPLTAYQLLAADQTNEICFHLTQAEGKAGQFSNIQPPQGEWAENTQVHRIIPIACLLKPISQDNMAISI